MVWADLVVIYEQGFLNGKYTINEPSSGACLWLSQRTPLVGSSPVLLDLLSVSSLKSISQFVTQCSPFRNLGF